jgi:anti-sigma factor RsiW
MPVAEMTCKELVELVTAYLEDRLSTVDHRRFDEHIAQCPYCDRYIEQFRITIRTLGRLPEESISPAAREDLLRTFRDWRSA